MKRLIPALFLLIVFTLPLPASGTETHEQQTVPVHLDDILNVSVSGYIDIAYGEAYQYSHTDEEYVIRLIEVLNKEFAQSIVETKANIEHLKTKQQPPLILSDELQTILDSLHIVEQHKGYHVATSEFEDYKIISSILIKYAGNRDDLYFHEDYRYSYPECLISSSRQNAQCRQRINEFYFDEKTPLLGKVDMEPYLPNGDNSSETSSGSDFLDSQCGHLVRDLLPRPYSRTIESTFNQYINRTSLSRQGPGSEYPGIPLF